MDHQYIKDENLVERYVQGRLPVEEQERFEQHFAECDECVAELELADDFATALRAAAAEDARRAVDAGLAAVLARWLRGPRAAVVLGALVGLALLPLWLVSENRRLAGDLERLRQPLAGVPSFLLTVARDAATPVPVLPVGAGEPWLTLAIEVDDDGVASYAVTLKDGRQQVRWHKEGLEPDLWGVLRVSFPGDLLPPGDYRLELEGRDAAGRGTTQAAYPFRIVTP